MIFSKRYKLAKIRKKVQVSKDQETAQSEMESNQFNVHVHTLLELTVQSELTLHTLNMMVFTQNSTCYAI